MMKYGVLVLLLAVSACGGPRAAAPPADVPAAEACASCGMPVANHRFAGQIVAPGEEARFFDDIGCLVKGAGSSFPTDGTAYVADHRTGAWVPAAQAVYSRVPGLATPMASHTIAHADAASREQDEVARGGTALSAREVFGAAFQKLGGR
jgi:copper chaperone NosL